MRLALDGLHILMLDLLFNEIRALYLLIWDGRPLHSARVHRCCRRELRLLLGLGLRHGLWLDLGCRLLLLCWGRWLVRPLVVEEVGVLVAVVSVVVAPQPLWLQRLLTAIAIVILLLPLFGPLRVDEAELRRLPGVRSLHLLVGPATQHRGLTLARGRDDAVLLTEARHVLVVHWPMRGNARVDRALVLQAALPWSERVPAARAMRQVA